MTIQEEIREGMARIICCFAKGNKSCAECEYNTPDTPFPDCFPDIREDTDQLLTYLHSQGVVIKVDRELPSYLKELAELKSAGGNTYGLICKFCGATCDITDDTFKFREQHESCWAGYVAVEPLIKDDK